MKEQLNEVPDNMLLFYNPGKAVRENLAYDHPFRLQGDPRSYQPAYHLLDMPEKGFFVIPKSVIVNGGDQYGEQEIIIPKLFERIMQLYRAVGVVRIDQNPRVPDPNVADTKEAARKLGDSLYMDFLRGKCGEWMQVVSQVKQAGGVPRAAQGLFKLALQECGYSDPADTVQVIEHERASASSKSDLQKEIDALKATVNQLIGSMTAPTGVSTTK